MIFLRPYFFLFLLALIPLYYFSSKNQKYSSWQKYLKKEFIPFLLTEETEKKSKNRSFLKISILWTLLTIALAGPSFEKTPTISSKPFEGTVLIADLNSLNQNTLTQLKIKLNQTINLLPDEKIGLVLFDDKGYTALPLSDDREVLKEIISVLNPSILPLSGQNFSAAFKKADELFVNTELKTGRILLFTGGILNTDTNIDKINSLPYKIGVIGLGNPSKPTPVLDKNGSFKRDINNNILLLAPNKKILNQIGKFVYQTPNDSDVKNIISQTKSLTIQPTNSLLENDFLKIDEYKDLGIYILVFLMPFIALLFRKGIFLILLTLFLATPSYADFWQREDQKIYQSNQKGIQEYKEKKYLDALTRFQKDSSANGFYNQGNAKAYLGNIPEAIQLYSTALQKDPNHKEAAFNKAYLENLMNQEKENKKNNDQKEEKKSNNNENTSSDQKDNNSQPQQQQQQQQPNSSNQNKDESNQSTPPQNQNLEGSNQNQENKSTQKDQTNDTQEKPLEPQEKNSSTKAHSSQGETEKTPPPIDQKTQEIFNRLKKDPARILKFRLYMQSQRG